MSRAPREYCENGIYHVMFRGHGKNEIFLENRDYEKFLEILQEIKEIKQFELYAFCLMTNHAHLVIKEAELKDVSDVMKRLIGKYTQWFNYKYGKSGGLMESRYKSRAVDTDEYLMHLIRYVHQNPIKAGLVENAADYTWSSYENYLKKDSGIIDTTLLFEILPKHDYEDFHKENENNEFTLYRDEGVNDAKIVMALKSMGIEDGNQLRYMPEEKRDLIIIELKKNFSHRQIERVTGISRFKIKNI